MTPIVWGSARAHWGYNCRGKLAGAPMMQSPLYFESDGQISDAFLLNLTSEGLGILVSTVLITFAIRATQLTSRWLSVRRPRKRILADSRADADVALDCIRGVADSNDRGDVRRGLRKYAIMMSSMAKRLEIARDLFAPSDAGPIVEFITDVHTVNAVIENDVEDIDALVLPLTTKSKDFIGRRDNKIVVPRFDYYTQAFFNLDQLFRRHGVHVVGVDKGYAPDFQEFLRSA
jgi:hypothetical protein